jgi:hypothetical protein
VNACCAFCGSGEATHLADSGTTPQRVKPESLPRCERCRDAAERNAELDALEDAGFEEETR